MSLQDLTNCPFRVVDEINQGNTTGLLHFSLNCMGVNLWHWGGLMHSSEYAGMDPINERKMFQQLVRAASQINTPQLVTVHSTLCTACRSADLSTSDNLPFLLPADASFWRPSFYLIWSTAMPAAFSTLWMAHGLRSQQKVLVRLCFLKKKTCWSYWWTEHVNILSLSCI